MSAETPGSDHDDTEPGLVGSGPQTFATTTERHCAHTWLEGSNQCIACREVVTQADFLLDDDTEALADWLSGQVETYPVDESPDGQETWIEISVTDLAERILASDWLAGYVASKVESIERERDEAQAEASDVGHDYDRRGERLWRLAALAGWTPGNESDNDATAEAYVTDALTQSRALIERATALVGEWTTASCQVDGAPCSWHRVAAECAIELRAALAPATEPASARPLTLDEHLAEVERRISLRACITGTDRHLDIIRAYREEVRRG